MDDSRPARRRSIRGIHDTYRNRWHAAGYPRPLAIVRKETVMMNLFAVLTNTGFHLAGWRHPSAWTDTMMNLEQYIEFAQKAEAAKLDAVFLARSEEHQSELQSLMRI